MAPMKRPAAGASSVAKKSKGGSLSKQYKEVAAALKRAEAYPPQVISMLSENVSLCFSTVVEERHGYAARIGQMIQEVLNSVKEVELKKVSEAEAKLAGAETDKAGREAKEAETKAALETAKAAVETAKKEVDAATADLKTKNAELKAAKQEQEAGDAELLKAEEQKGKLEKIMTTVFAPCKEGSIESSTVKSSIGEVGKLGKEFNFDAALMHSLPSALGKAPSVRGSFDDLVVQQVEAEMKKCQDKLQAQLEEGAAGRTQRADKVASAQAAVDAASATKTSNEEALKAAQTAEKEASKIAQEASKALKSFGKEMNEVSTALEEAKEGLAEFEDGPMAAFKELTERTNIVPEEPQEELKEGDLPSLSADA
eukprot:TRINITY_DN77723_c0_g1_i1.p1 TRINITY_DN77723_c0_g1~~TRINITY_DN77723_c0_g1_i1.p1  ORF type:complete len:389 (-),score=167.31 TRINITY_DN77723_c0_g1_i1:146-1255(-)